MILRSFFVRSSWGPHVRGQDALEAPAPAVGRLDFGDAACPPGKEQQAQHASHSRRRASRAARTQTGSGLANYRKRAGAFGVIQLWIVNSFMIEVLADEMQADAVAKIF